MASGAAAAPSELAQLTLNVLDVDEEVGTPSSLGSFRDGKPLVLEFWHTRCVKCPSALTWVDAQAAKHPGVTFASCALSLGSETEGTQEQVLELLDGQWENLKHLYMSFDEKEAAKKALGFTALPFCAVFAQDGSVVYRGDPHGADFATVFDAKPAVEEETIAAGMAKSCAVQESQAKPLAEANRAPVVLGFGNDDEDF